MASITDGWQSVDMDFWRVEVPPGKLTTCHLGKKYYLHISQASLGDKGVGDKTRVVLRAKAGNHEVIIGTLTQGQCDQMRLDLIFSKDFSLYHNSNTCSVSFCGYTIEANAGEDLDDSREDERNESSRAVENMISSFEAAITHENKKGEYSDVGAEKGAILLKEKVETYAVKKKLGIVLKLEKDIENKNKDVNKSGHGDDNGNEFEKKRKSSFKVEVTPAGKKIRSATVMGTSKGNQSHANYWESLIAAGRSTEKESLEARSLHAPPACPSQQAQQPGSIAEEVDTKNESLHNKEKKTREVLHFDGGEKQIMPPFDNGATSFKGKSVFPNCEQCSRKFATAYALNQHNAAKHQ